MSCITFAAGDKKAVLELLQSNFTPSSLQTLVGTIYEAAALARKVNWKSDLEDVAFQTLESGNALGVLEHILVAAASERPHRPDLRGLVMRLASRSGWSLPIERGAGSGLPAALEALTRRGRTFVDTALLVRWLIRSERQVCQVLCGDGTGGTGFLIGPDLVLTCFHVVAVEGKLRPPEQLRVRFDYRRGFDGSEAPANLPEFEVDPAWLVPHAAPGDADLNDVGEPGSGELDFALLRLREPLGERSPAGETDPRGWIDLSSEPQLPSKDDLVLVVQHPRQEHPHGQQPLQVTFGDFFEANPPRTRVRYRPSTLQGSSGAPVCAAQADGSIRAFALHNRGGSIAAGLADHNRGVPLGAIRQALPAEVRGQLRRPPPPPADVLGRS